MAIFATIKQRTQQSTPLTYLEVDTNFVNLQKASAPIGTIFIYTATADLPDTWLLCQGQSLATATYADLYTIIGNTYGGDATNFNLPDLRGMFVRGLDAGRGDDDGRVLGTRQEDEIKSHTHTAQLWDATGDAPRGDPRFTQYVDPILRATGTTDATGGSETRPKNVAMEYIIKASIV